MKIIYWVAIGVVVYLGATYIRFKYVLAKADLPIIVQTEQKFGSGPNLMYVSGGDSTAEGQGASVVEKTYTYRVAEYLSMKSMVEYKNVGKGGARTADFMEEQLPVILQSKPDIVTISIGANDLTRLKSNEYIVGNITKIVEELKEQTEADIYIANIPNFSWAKLLPGPYRMLLQYKAQAINTELAKLESERVKVIDIHNFGWDNYPDVSVTNAADQFHPNDEGYDNWTRAFLSKVKAKY